MIYFTIVELLDATPDDYENLDRSMALAGFARTTKSKAGQPYHLPRGVYHSRSRYHSSEVLAIARAAADSISRKSEILTIESAGTRWFPNVETVNTAQIQEG